MPSEECFCQNPEWQRTRDGLVKKLREIRDFVYTLREKRAIPMKYEMDGIVEFFEGGKFGKVGTGSFSRHKPVTREDMLRETEILWWETTDPSVKAKLQEQIAGLKGFSLKSKEQPELPPEEIDRQLINDVLGYVFDNSTEHTPCLPQIQ